MMNSSNTFRLANHALGRLPSGMNYWQFVASLNGKLFKNFSRALADQEDQPLPCCELGKMEVDTLLKKYRENGDGSFIAEVYKRYAHLVLGTCLKYLKDEAAANDAVSDIFAKLVVKLRAFLPNYFPGWLYKVSVNHCLEVLRKNQVGPQFETLDATNELELISEPEIPEYIEREHRHRELAMAIKALPERQRKAIELFFLEGLSYKQVAEHTGFSMKDVKSYVQNGKRNLRIMLSASAREFGWKKSI